MIINWLFDNLPICIIDNYYPFFNNQFNNKFFDNDIDNLCDPKKNFKKTTYPKII